MRTTIKSFAIALVVSTLVTAPGFAARNDAKHKPRTQDQQPSIIERVMNHVKRILDTPILTTPSDTPILTTPSDTPILTTPSDGH
jgi:hypothetical protein